MLKVYLLLIFATIVVAERGHRRRGPPRCGLPTFTDRLPEDAAEKIKKIWEKFVDGEGCDKEHQATKDILDELPSDVRAKAMRFKGPSFLRGVSDEVRLQFDNLWKDHSIPRDEKPEKFKELAEKVLNAEQLKEFNKFHAAVKRRREEFQKKLAKLSPEAREAHEKLTKLREERHKIFMEASPSVRAELNKLYHDDRFGIGDETRKESTRRH
ncbi:unnamed protein product [Heligmosomoides polygyrus]|uniref:DUF148 domain-containing protein n=1 Tax=Heligmosomoides polygyrus TaxID=6339 RepID=A0A183GC29_HELPZ|nr:unnamed protein product [Heligmosomoides polygyrus]